MCGCSGVCHRIENLCAQWQVVDLKETENHLNSTLKNLEYQCVRPSSVGRCFLSYSFLMLHESIEKLYVFGFVLCQVVCVWIQNFWDLFSYADDKISQAGMIKESFCIAAYNRPSMFYYRRSTKNFVDEFIVIEDVTIIKMGFVDCGNGGAFGYCIYKT